MSPFEGNPFASAEAHDAPPPTLRTGSGRDVPSGVRLRHEYVPASEPVSEPSPSSIEAWDLMTDDKGAVSEEETEEAPMTLRTGAAPRRSLEMQSTASSLVERLTPSEIAETVQEVHASVAYLERLLVPVLDVEVYEERLSMARYRAEQILHLVPATFPDKHLQEIRPLMKDVTETTLIALKSIAYIESYRETYASPKARDRYRLERKRLRDAKDVLQTILVDLKEWLEYRQALENIETIARERVKVDRQKPTEIDEEEAPMAVRGSSENDDDRRYPSQGVL